MSAARALTSFWLDLGVKANAALHRPARVVVLYPVADIGRNATIVGLQGAFHLDLALGGEKLLLLPGTETEQTRGAAKIAGGGGGGIHGSSSRQWSWKFPRQTPAATRSRATSGIQQRNQGWEFTHQDGGALTIRLPVDLAPTRCDTLSRLKVSPVTPSQPAPLATVATRTVRTVVPGHHGTSPPAVGSRLHWLHGVTPLKCWGTPSVYPLHQGGTLCTAPQQTASRWEPMEGKAPCVV